MFCAFGSEPVITWVGAENPLPLGETISPVAVSNKQGCYQMSKVLLYLHQQFFKLLELDFGHICDHIDD